MKVFKVEPIASKLHHKSWDRAQYKGSIVVRAENKAEAIRKLNSEFQLAVLYVSLGSRVIYSPWENMELVTWQEINDPDYPAEGETAIMTVYPTIDIRDLAE